MLTFKTMHWDNCFSYGDSNVIHFDKEPLVQLVGPNGAGKTSISLMIQEVLYGKNNKTIKKTDIANNKSGKKGYYILLEFDKDGDQYIVELNRTSNLKLKLLKNGDDISSHSSLDTYKTIAEIIGISDFKLFCQLIYQHSTDSLDFLTATDTNRKKFLISLLQLDRYLELHELFKAKSRQITSDISVVEGKISTIESWITRHEDMDFVKKELVPVPEMNETWIKRQHELEDQIANIHSINRKISTNNQYILELDRLDSEYYLNSGPVQPNPNSHDLRLGKRVLERSLTLHQAKLDKLKSLSGQCPECLQEVDMEQQLLMISEETVLKGTAKGDLNKIKQEIVEVEKIENEIAKYEDAKRSFERLNQLIDHSLPKRALDLHELQNELGTLKIDLLTLKAQIAEAELQNQEVAAHNSKVDVVKAQLEQMREDLHEQNIALAESENLKIIVELLKKTFGTNGLVSYKIESSVKELEKRINTYLADLSDFQMYFKLSGEKLNLEIFDGKNNQTAVQNLSSGERARLNLASILAIRNILSSLTNTKINLLFLDEITGSLDAEGKEKFSEILLKENLNTFFVSHEWTHPLVPCINIVKEHDISRIENA